MSQPNWQAIEEAYANGAADVEIAALLGITIGRFFSLVQEHEPFAALVEKGRTMSQAWWVSQGRLNLKNKEFQSTLYNFNMKNRYGWADKIDTQDTTGKENINQDQLRAEFNVLLKRVAKSNPELLSSVHLVEAAVNDD